MIMVVNKPAVIFKTPIRPAKINIEGQPLLMRSFGWQ